MSRLPSAWSSMMVGGCAVPRSPSNLERFWDGFPISGFPTHGCASAWEHSVTHNGHNLFSPPDLFAAFRPLAPERRASLAPFRWRTVLGGGRNARALLLASNRWYFSLNLDLNELITQSALATVCLMSFAFANKKILQYVSLLYMFGMHRYRQ